MGLIDDDQVAPEVLEMAAGLGAPRDEPRGDDADPPGTPADPNRSDGGVLDPLLVPPIGVLGVGPTSGILVQQGCIVFNPAMTW